MYYSHINGLHVNKSQRTLNKMADCKGKTTLKLLLIVTMVMQPMAYSYAMARTDHSHRHASISAGHNHDEHHAMDDPVSDAQHQPHNGAGVLVDCCDSAVCYAAVVVDAEALSYMQNSAITTSSSSSWKGVDLPTEIRPPRSFFG